MDNDDLPVGRVLTRREALALLGTVSAGVLAACAPGQSAVTQVVNTLAPTSVATQASGATASATSTAFQSLPATNAVAIPSCIVRPAMTEGPYFVDEKLLRSDIRSDPTDGTVKEGVPLVLTFGVAQISNGSCVPLAGASVDIWHCDAAGVYSDANDPGFNTKGKKFLRGYQVTDANGLATFTTIYPGWYQGRTVHIHFKIRTRSGYEFTSQLFFDDTFTDKVFEQEPYASKGIRTLRNDGDNIYRNGGDQLLLTCTEAAEGYTSTFDIGLQI
jgi:protocatechuate 3,4-dioxygenase beta subunit